MHIILTKHILGAQWLHLPSLPLPNVIWAKNNHILECLHPNQGVDCDSDLVNCTFSACKGYHSSGWYCEWFPRIPIESTISRAEVTLSWHLLLPPDSRSCSLSLSTTYCFPLWTGGCRLSFSLLQSIYIATSFHPWDPVSLCMYVFLNILNMWWEQWGLANFNVPRTTLYFAMLQSYSIEKN